jgi:hypothetical protein
MVSIDHPKPRKSVTRFLNDVSAAHGGLRKYFGEKVRDFLSGKLRGRHTAISQHLISVI